MPQIAVQVLHRDPGSLWERFAGAPPRKRWTLHLSRIPHPLRAPSYTAAGYHGCINPETAPFVWVDLVEGSGDVLELQGDTWEEVTRAFLQRLSWWPPGVRQAVLAAGHELYKAAAGEVECACSTCTRRRSEGTW